MKQAKTSRGFQKYTFSDRYDVKCSLQKSSIASEDCIWLGCEEANPRVLVRGKGWVPIKIEGTVLFDKRMHLTRKQVFKFLPILIRFVLTGNI